MKTLWERLSRENKEKLKSCPYRFTAEKVICELKSEVAWTNLRFESVIFLMRKTTGEETLIENVDNLFNYEKI
jgi:hypothetical protein